MSIPAAPQNAIWDCEAATQAFQDPFFMAEFQSWVPPEAIIIEYGCGYGRLVDLLQRQACQHVTGYDFSEQMIARGRQQFPALNLHHIQHAELPVASASVDAVVMSTVLCCVPAEESQQEIMTEIHRVLKDGGILYCTDFLLTDAPAMRQKYEKYREQFGIYGVYQTSSGAIVRHQSHEQLSRLLTAFEPCWYHETDFVTMNGNPVRAFHGIYRKKS